jgi:hypothetical protein
MVKIIYVRYCTLASLHGKVAQPSSFVFDGLEVEELQV